MKKLLIPLTVIVGMFVSACGSPNCDALKKQCDACTNATGKSTCNAAHTTNMTLGGSAGDANCKALIDAKTYEATSAVCK